MESATAVTFLVLSSVNNDFFINVFFPGGCCETRCVGTTKRKNIPNIGARVTCRIKYSVKEASMLGLKICMLCFL